MRKKDIKNKIAYVFIGILCFFLVCFIGIFITNMVEERSYYVSDEEDLFWNLRYDNYVSLLEDVKANEARHVKKTGGMEKCYAIAYYYEAASMYKAYMEVGETQKAAKKKQIMEAQIPLMGEYSTLIQDIHKRLNLD
ncbi:MAG: hypothetical protein MJ134_05040 [Lachnospiraceae bacterium]|nr:hypothetical protein [Lachnospiraceae bacterium]